MQVWAAKLDKEDLHFCAAVSVGALWLVAGQFSPAPGDVPGKGEEVNMKTKRQVAVVGRKSDATHAAASQLSVER